LENPHPHPLARLDLGRTVNDESFCSMMVSSNNWNHGTMGPWGHGAMGPWGVRDHPVPIMIQTSSPACHPKNDPWG